MDTKWSLVKLEKLRNADYRKLDVKVVIAFQEFVIYKYSFSTYCSCIWYRSVVKMFKFCCTWRLFKAKKCMFRLAPVHWPMICLAWLCHFSTHLALFFLCWGSHRIGNFSFFKINFFFVFIIIWLRACNFSKTADM